MVRPCVFIYIYLMGRLCFCFFICLAKSRVYSFGFEDFSKTTVYCVFTNILAESIEHQQGLPPLALSGSRGFLAFNFTTAEN